MARRSAVPQQFFESHLYTGADIAPGHRFGLFFPIWNDKDWRAEEDKRGALGDVVKISSRDSAFLESLLPRQAHLAAQGGDRHLAIRALATAPFMTGIGNEHPLENGFSFLSPYGIPYLPGSAVKGIVRRAAEGLALGLYGDTAGWDVLSIWWLFGFEPTSAYLTGDDGGLKKEGETWRRAYVACNEKKSYNEPALSLFIRNVLAGEDRIFFEKQPEAFLCALIDNGVQVPGKSKSFREKIHFRGALSFWDVFPKPGSEGLLKIEILTPHYREYYEKGKSPADCGQPNPIPFLTVAPGCEFRFHVRCRDDLLPEFLKAKWKALVETAFDHAFSWVGFGARTALGYGQLQRMVSQGAEKPGRRETAGPDVKPSFGATSRNSEIWEKAVLSWRPNDQVIIASCGTKKALGREKSLLPESLFARLVGRRRQPITARVEVEILGNSIRIVRINPTEN